jgi:hypothetical protein
MPHAQAWAQANGKCWAASVMKLLLSALSEVLFIIQVHGVIP